MVARQGANLPRCSALAAGCGGCVWTMMIVSLGPSDLEQTKFCTARQWQNVERALVERS